MAAAATTNAAGRPKRKRQRRRRTNVASDGSDSSSSSSDSSSSSSSSDSDSEDEAPKVAPAAAVAAASSSSSGSLSDDSDDSSGAESDSSSGSDLSFLGEGIADGGRRRGRGRRRAAAVAATTTAGTTTNGGDSAMMVDGTTQHASSVATGPRRAPYPERSPSPASKLARLDPREFVPLGTGIFPLIENRIRAVNGGGSSNKGGKASKIDDVANEQETTVAGGEGTQILEGLVAGDADAAQQGDAQQEQDAAVEATRKRQDRFGDWWRARLVSEFEGDLGKLAAEPGLTPTRLSLLLTSLTTLSSLHTSSTAPASSIWAHNPNASLDPLAGLPTPQGADALVDAVGAGEEWASTRVGGEGDVQVGEEGVVADEQRTAALAAAAALSEGGKKSKKEKKLRKSLGAAGQEASPSAAAAAAPTVAVAVAAEVDGVAQQKEVTVASSPAKKEKKSKKKGRKSGLSDAGGDQMDVDV